MKRNYIIPAIAAVSAYLSPGIAKADTGISDSGESANTMAAEDVFDEEVSAEIKRSGTQVFQILQDFGIMDADAILQVMANHVGAEVISLKNVELPKEAIAALPANSAKMYRCIPVELEGSTLRVALSVT